MKGRKKKRAQSKMQELLENLRLFFRTGGEKGCLPAIYPAFINSQAMVAIQSEPDCGKTPDLSRKTEGAKSLKWFGVDMPNDVVCACTWNDLQPQPLS
jgi:hypothetical protein